MSRESVIVDVSFKVQGHSVPADHGYGLLGALSRVAPDIHGDQLIGIHPLLGVPAPERRLTLLPTTRLRIRLPAASIPLILPLAGVHLDVDGARLLVGVPEVHPLRPAPALQSRLVTVKGFTDPAAFLQAARRQLDALAVGGSLEVPRTKAASAYEGRASRSVGAYVRRTLTIHGREIVGFPLRVHDLSAEESIRLQAAGLGGRRRFGCGIFVPAGGKPV